MPEPLDRAELLRQKEGLEALARDLALRVAAFHEPSAIAEFEDVRAQIAVLERDLAASIRAT